MLEVSLFLIAAVTALVHAVWGLKIWWPIADEAQLAKHVVGVQGIEKMPGIAITWGVVGLVCVGCIVIALLAGWVAHPFPSWLLNTAAWTMGGILTIRAIYPYVFDKKMRQEPVFRRLNRRYYSPLILYLGLGTLSLTC